MADQRLTKHFLENGHFTFFIFFPHIFWRLTRDKLMISMVFHIEKLILIFINIILQKKLFNYPLQIEETHSLLVF